MIRFFFEVVFVDSFFGERVVFFVELGVVIVGAGLFFSVSDMVVDCEGDTFHHGALIGLRHGGVVDVDG